VIPPTPPPKPTTFQPGLPETGGLFDGPWQVGFKPADPSGDALSGAADAPENQLVQELEESPPNPPPRRRGRPRKQSQPARVAASSPPPPPRRSARIAARNANPPPPPPAVTAQGTRTRRSRGPPAAPPSLNGPSAADTPKNRGRPRKKQDGSITKPVASTSKKARRASGRTAAVAVAAAARVVDGEVTKGVAAAGKRRRGRPRRTG
jgi:hypothetical protein